jgi:hypothetical protein
MGGKGNDVIPSTGEKGERSHTMSYISPLSDHHITTKRQAVSSFQMRKGKLKQVMGKSVR